MKTSDQQHILEEILSTSKDLEEILERTTQVIKVTNLKTRSLYLYDKVLDQYFIESDASRFDEHRRNRSVKELTKTRYFEATLPDWGSEIINCLDE